MLLPRWTILIPVVALAFTLPMTAGAAPQIISSGMARVSLLELYTSEGCSSCPPAEAWLSKFTDDKRLWTQLVPVAFHVDYWDDLGWHDPFDSHTYTLRQQEYAQHWGNGVVYTPEFILNGEEWNIWYDLHPLRLTHTPDAGDLMLTVDGIHMTASFTPATSHYKSLELHVALLAFGVTTKVGAGENAGRELQHDFLVIDYIQHPFAATASGFTAAMPLPKSVSVKASRYALAAWVSLPSDPTPLQATGGWLPLSP